MQIIDATKDGRDKTSIELWLNGRKVTYLTQRALLPNKPGRIGVGWADIYNATEDGHIAYPAIIKRKFGIVYYRPKE